MSDRQRKWLGFSLFVLTIPAAAFVPHIISFLFGIPFDASVDIGFTTLSMRYMTAIVFIGAASFFSRGKKAGN